MKKKNNKKINLMIVKRPIQLNNNQIIKEGTFVKEYQGYNFGICKNSIFNPHDNNIMINIKINSSVNNDDTNFSKSFYCVKKDDLILYSKKREKFFTRFKSFIKKKMIN